MITVTTSPTTKITVDVRQIENPDVVCVINNFFFA